MVGRSAGSKIVINVCHSQSHREAYGCCSKSAQLALYTWRNDTLIAVMNTSLRVLDPIITRDNAYMIYKVLTAQNDEYQVQPQMADGTMSDDGIVFKLTGALQAD